MNAVMMCGLAKVKRRRIPNLLLGICIMITAVLIVNALVFIRELDAIFDRAYEGMKGAQMCCLWSNSVVSCDDVRQYMDNSLDVSDYQITENTKTIDFIEKDGVKLGNGILSELPEDIQTGEEQRGIHADGGERMLSPKIIDGSQLEMPGKGEVWITTKIANILNLKAGDDISFKLSDTSVSVKVVKIVADPVFGGSSTNIYRMWCGYGMISEFPLAENSAVSYLEIRFREYSPETEQEFIRKTEEYFQMPLGDTLYTYEKIKGGYTSLYQMAGAVLCLVSVILAATVIVLVLFLIKSDMDEDIRNIGICLSLGMTGGQVIGTYLISYGIIGAAGALAGSVLGRWMNRGLISGILGDMGIYGVSFTETEKYPFLVWVLIMTVIMAVCLCSIFKIQRLNASDAVRTGAWKTKDKSRKAGRKACCAGGSFELFYAVRGITSKKASYLYIVSVSLIFGCLACVCQGCLTAVRNIDDQPENWGFIKTDIYVTSLEDTPVSSIMDELEQDPRVDYTYGVNKVYPSYQPAEGESWQSMVTELYELPWNEKIEDRSLYGRRPREEDEISVGLTLAEEYGLTIGETMVLFVNGEKKAYEITGIFQTLSNSGKVIRMVTDDLDRFMEAEAGFGDYMLVLSDGVDKWEYGKELNEEYGERFSFIASKSNGENISGVLSSVVNTVLSVLLVILVLVTTNLTFLLVRREQRLIGLLKAVGMTPWQILKIYLWRNCLCAVCGTVLGFLAGTFIVPGLLTPYAKGFGLTEFPFSHSLEGVFAGIGLLPVCIFLGTCVVVRAVNRVSVKELVSE